MIGQAHIHRCTRRPAPTMPARQAAPKPAYRIRNWSRYNDALVNRGALTLWVHPENPQAWRYRGPSQRGAQFRFSDTAIECLLTLRAGRRPSAIPEGVKVASHVRGVLDQTDSHGSASGRRCLVAALESPHNVHRGLSD